MRYRPRVKANSLVQAVRFNSETSEFLRTARALYDLVWTKAEEDLSALHRQQLNKETIKKKLAYLVRIFEFCSLKLLKISDLMPLTGKLSYSYQPGTQSYLLNQQ
jgi:hypothetical protein